MELMVVLLLGGIVLLMVLWGNQSRLRSELKSLQHQMQELQDKVNWLIIGHGQREQHGKPAKPADPPSRDKAPLPEFRSKTQVPGTDPSASETSNVLHKQPDGSKELKRPWICRGCRVSNEASAKYCVQCGLSVTGESEQKLQQPPVAAERQLDDPGTDSTSDRIGSFEQLIGQRWMTWVGALFIIVAVGAAVKVMFDMGLFSPWWRLVLECVLGGLVLLFGRYLLKQKMLALGHAMQGVGLAVFYVSFYAAYNYHSLMSAALTLVLVALVTAGGMLIAIRYESVAIAILAILGGLITPGMVSQGNDIQHVLFSYILVLDLGVLYVALVKHWRNLDTAAFGGTVLLFINWASDNYSADLLNPTMVWLSIFFVIFMLVPFVYSMRTREPLSVERFIAALLNATIMIIASWHFLAPVNLAALGTISLVMCLCYLVLAVAFRLRIPIDHRSHQGLMALAVVFLTLSVPLLLKFNAVIVTWAIEAPLLVWLGLRFGSRLVRGSAIPVLIVALLRFLVLHWSGNIETGLIFFNPQFGTAICIPLAAGVAAWIHHQSGAMARDFDRSNKIVLAIGGGLLALLLINHEVSAWFARLAMDGLQYQNYYNWTTQLLVWVIGVALFMVAGLFWSSTAARQTSKLLLAIAVVVGFWTYFGLLDRGLDVPGGYALFWSYRFSAILFLVIVVFGLAWLHSALADRLPQSEDRLPVHLGIIGGLLVLILFAGEINFWFALRHIRIEAGIRIISLSWQTLVWALGAVGFLAAGLFWRCSEVRRAGITPLLFGTLAGIGAYQGAHGMLVDPKDGGLPLLNIRFIFVLAMVLAVFAWGLFIRRCRHICSAEDQQLATVAYVSADIMLLLLLSTEFYKFFNAVDLPGQLAANQANVALSIVWGVYALAFIITGFWLNKALMRMWAMGLLGITAVKLVIFDLNHLPPLFRLLSLVVVGLLMLTTAFLYHRAEKQLVARGGDRGA